MAADGLAPRARPVVFIMPDMVQRLLVADIVDDVHVLHRVEHVAVVHGDALVSVPGALRRVGDGNDRAVRQLHAHGAGDNLGVGIGRGRKHDARSKHGEEIGA